MFGLNRNKPGRRQEPKQFRSILSSDAPFAYKEAFKTLRTNLDFVASANNLKVIAVTSALPDEGKSNTVINLAIALAGNGHSVVIVECDMRKPCMRKYLKISRNAKGLSAYLAGRAKLEECLLASQALRISTVHAGIVPPNPSELLNHPRMKQLLEILRGKYDYVLLDTPPVMLVTDAAVLGQIADGVILTVRSRYAQSQTLQMAKNRLESVGAHLMGVVLTRYDLKKSGLEHSRYEY